jgi:hypothetical protein
MGTLKTERWDLKGCEIFYGFVKFYFVSMHLTVSNVNSVHRFSQCRTLTAAIADGREKAQLCLKRVQIGQTFQFALVLYKIQLMAYK